MRINCLRPSMWKARNDEARSAVETMPCCPPLIMFMGQRANYFARMLTYKLSPVTVILLSFIPLLSS